MKIVAEHTTFARRRLGIMAGGAVGNTRQQNIAGLHALIDLMAASASDSLVRSMMESPSRQPAVRGRGRFNDGLRDAARNVVAKRAAVEPGHSLSIDRADSGFRSAPILVEENSLSERLTGDLRFLNSPHLGLNKSGESAPFGNPEHLPAESFILFWQARKKGLDELHLSVGEMNLRIHFVKLKRMAGLAVSLVPNRFVISS